jgi:hypothetical protein
MGGGWGVYIDGVTRYKAKGSVSSKAESGK